MKYEKEEIERGKWYPPLIIQLKTGRYYLVAGNTRLMVCKVNNYVPREIVRNVE